MGSSENFCLRWNDFEANVSGAFRDLRAESDFFDVTLGCSDSNGRSLQAHKVILSACSSFFKGMLRQQAQHNPSHPNPYIYLRGVSYCDLSSVLDFMYHGEVNVAQEDLNSFLAVAEELQIKGLTNKEGEASKPGTSSKPAARSKPSSDGGPPVKRRRPSPVPSGGPSSSSTSGAAAGGSGGGASGGGGASTADVKSVVDIKSDPEAGTSGQAVQDFDETGDYGEGDYTGDYGDYDNGEGGDSMLGDVSVEGAEESGGGKGQLFDSMERLSSERGLITWKCKLCGYTSKKSTNCKRHMLFKHGTNENLPCVFCGQLNRNKISLDKHQAKCLKKQQASDAAELLMRDQMRSTVLIQTMNADSD